jgi:predicted nucleic acid-binding protein
VPSIAVDAGPLVALFKGADHFHGAAVAFMGNVKVPLVTNVAVISEVVALLASRFQADFLAWAQGALQIDGQTIDDLPRIIEIMRKYADLPADFADAALVAMCERRGIVSVASLDRHFDVYRTADRKRLRNVFFAR